ncbi:hypothetical protein FXV77_04150 [Sphingobacterium phlebotomi]|uniref:Uncharacterized protein n=1 Tax=Sphingobacterium phlebotomi TaxID=2605433 RepID=A0A5D4HBL8_9SPHI|nr:hypothetical protein [Sphingobacterium phlebotomi]TYR37219.1 hypothetical protein FXV77_04150 [Sphingobacterium phlebotomi]
MGIPLAIADFIFELEKGLDISFSRQCLNEVVILHSKTPYFALAIYFAENGGRINVGNIRTFHIDQDQILKDPYKILSRLHALLGKGKVIYARQTVVARIDKRITLAFLEENHLQVAIPGKYRYGLFHEGELLSVAIFSGGRRMREQASNYRSFELIRFCHKAGYRVVGGISKLLKAFTEDFHPNDIMTYVDRDWAQVSNLHTLGFREQGHTSPQAFWIVDKDRYYIAHAEHLSKLKQTYPTGYLSHNQGSTKLVLTL